MERRQSTRTEVAMKVYLSGPGRRIRGYTVGNLSGQGLFIPAVQHDLYRGAVVRAMFTLPRGGNVVEIRRIPAIVARVEQGGFGLMFTRRGSVALPRHESPGGAIGNA